jgi:superfamily II DNA/RNA helicase
MALCDVASNVNQALGSGKTLAYLLPVVQQLKREEAATGGRAGQTLNPRILR